MSQAKIEALRFARNWIKRGHDEYICFALDSTPDYLRPAALELIGEISRRLGNCVTVGQWLRQNVPEADKFYRGPNWQQWLNQCRLYRLRWIDELIKEYS